MQKGKNFINGIEQVEKSINSDTNIIVDSEEEETNKIAFELIGDLVKTTWPDKYIIQYENTNSQIAKTKYDKKTRKKSN